MFLWDNASHKLRTPSHFAKCEPLIRTLDMDQKIFSFKHKVHNWLKEGEKLRKSDQVSRCSSKSSSKHSSKSSAKSSSSSKSRSSAKTKANEKKVKVAELMMEASFIKSNQIFLLQVYFGPINSTLYLHVKKLTIACNSCVERIVVRLNIV